MAVTKVQMTLTKPVTFVTGNAKKLEEVKMILGQSIPFQSLKLDLPELQPEDTSEETARLAAKEGRDYENASFSRSYMAEQCEQAVKSKSRSSILIDC